jgi:hypothetical protein
VTSNLDLGKAINAYVTSIERSLGYSGYDIHKAWQNRGGSRQAEASGAELVQKLEWLQTQWPDGLVRPLPSVTHLHQCDGGLAGMWRGECPSCKRGVQFKAEYDRATDTDRRSRCRWCKHEHRIHYMELYSCECAECQYEVRHFKEQQANTEFWLSDGKGYRLVKNPFGKKEPGS